MAQRKRKHGKVESRKARPMIRFKPGVLLLLIIIAFAGVFALYLVTATAQPDYWEREILGTTEATQEFEPVATESAVPSAAANPVPASERADESRMAVCAWIGDVAELTTYYKTASEMVFTDAVSGITESRMRSIAQTLAESDPQAIYLWYACPEDAQQGAADVANFVDILQERLGVMPIYVLSALPLAEDTDANKTTDAWNEALFSLVDERGAYFVDISTKLKGNDGCLAPRYTDEDALYEMVGELILTHVAE